jgi:cell division protein FtsB
VLAGAAVLAWSAWALAAQYSRTYALGREAARLDERRRELVASNEALREEIQRLRTDDKYLAWLARKELGMVRPGEVEFLIVSPQGGEPTGAIGGEPDRRGAAATSPDPGAITAPAPDAGAARIPRGGWIERLLRRVTAWAARLHLIR